VGDTPNLAAALVTRAAAKMVVIADTTRRLAGELFDYKSLGPAQLKGTSIQVNGWAALAERTVDSRFEALRTGNLPLVGRAEELELLLRRWAQAQAGAGRVVLLTGEPGIGKSRLVAALEHSLRQAPHALVRIACSPHHRDSPLYPIICQIERAANFERGDSATGRLEKLARLFEADTAANPEVAVIADLLSISRPEWAPSELNARQRREMILSAVLRQFSRLRRDNTLLVVLEDLHWADPTTLDLLAALIERVEQLPMLLVVTSRPELRVPWSARPQVTVQPLSLLHRREAGLLIRAVAGARDLPHELVDRIIVRADGVPLFIEELTKSVFESGLQSGDGTRHSQPLPSELIPTTLQASLMARLDRLGSGKEVAQIGSVVGREFSFELLQGLWRSPLKRLEEALGELVQTGLATAFGQPPHSVYAFKHALVQDAAYASLLREQRRSIHLRLAELLEKEKDRLDGALPEIIAWHFAESGAPARSIDYYLKAAEQTTGRLALAEKVSHLRKGLQQVEHLPESLDKDRLELSIQVALGQVLIDHQGSGSEDMRIAFERARELCLQLDDVKELLRVYDGLVNYSYSHSEPEKMLRYASELLDVGHRMGDPQALLMAQKSSAYANLLLGGFEQAREDMQHLLEIYDGQRDGPEAGVTTRDPKMAAYTMLGICLTALGFPDSGTAKSLEGVKYAETLNHVISLILALRRACVQHMMRRDTQTVLRLSERLLGLANEFETFKGVRDGAIFYSWAQLQTRQDARLLERMQACIEHFDTSRHWAMLPFFMASAADVQQKCGDVSGAVALLDRATELVRLTGEQWSEPEILRLQACVARDSDEIITLLHASLRKARQQRAKLWELRAATSLAKFWLERSNPEAARNVLAPVHAWFTEGLDTPDLVTAGALLHSLKDEARMKL
jgi:predicted ATPase